MEMLIQSSLTNSLSVELSLASNLVNQQNLLCDWSNCGTMWQNSPNDNTNNVGKSTCTKGVNKFTCSKLKENLKPSSDISASKDICASKWNGIIYRRRKLPKENAIVCNNIESKWGGVVYKRRRLSGSNSGKNSPKSRVIFAKPLAEINSTREFCISVLKMHGLLVGVNNTHASVSSGVESISEANITQSCKICRHLENPLNMLICDLCEEAFHLHCHHPKVKKIPVDYWLCQSCLRKKTKALLKQSSENSADIFNENINYRGKGGPIMCMLRDDQPFISGVRVGKDYQAEVSEWSGPVSKDFTYCSEHLLMDHTECSSLDICNDEKISESSFIGNWIQCRQIIHKSSKDKGTICGKWRRAPLFVVQTGDWDCSCCVLWDPIHADCAVPQELETEVILEHLKYLQMVRKPSLDYAFYVPV